LSLYLKNQTLKKLQNTAIIKWQANVDLLASLTSATATAIMRGTPNDGFKALVVNQSEACTRLINGSHDLLESYCETVYRHQGKLWTSYDSGMIPFQAFPIRNPDKSPFGALCLVGFKAVHHTAAYRRIVEQFTSSIEADLKINGICLEKSLANILSTGNGEEKYIRLFESSRDSIFILNENHLFVECNEMALNMLERSRSEIIGRTPANISPKFQPNGSLSSDLAKKDTSLAFQGIDLCFEWVLLKSDGSPVPVEVSLCGFTENKEKYIYALVRNFTEKKIREKELSESEERFRTIYTQSADGVVLIEYLKGITECNNAAYNMLGLDSKEDLIGRRVMEFSPEIQPDGSRSSEASMAHIRTCLKNGQTRFEWVHLKKDGTPIWLDIVLTRIKYGNRELVHALWRDISNVKHFQNELLKHQYHLEELVDKKSKELLLAYEESQNLNEKLKHANSGLLKSNEKLSYQKKKLEDLLIELQNTREQLIDSEKMAVLGILTKGVAHEINNPLNFIAGGSHLLESNLKEHFPEVIPMVDSFLDSINKGVDQIAEIVKFLGKYRRDFNRPKTICDVNEVVKDCLTILKIQYEERSIEVKLNLFGEPIIFLANVGEMHHAILNILINAVEAISGSGNIHISSERTSDMISLIISDDGHGINEADFKKIYDPFFTTKDPGKYSGIGLSMTKKIIMDHRGSIKCKSKPGSGSTFTVNLPLAT
jgi:PAS domain S-box-containing protein